MERGTENERDEHGFTLIELMVVLGIIAIVIAMAGTTYVSATVRAKDRAAQARLKTALSSVKAIAVERDGRFEAPDATPLAPPVLSDEAPELTFVAAAPAGPAVAVKVDADPVDTAAAPNTRILLYAPSATGTWFGVATTRSGEVRFCRGASETAVSQPESCVGAKW